MVNEKSISDSLRLGQVLVETCMSPMQEALTESKRKSGNIYDGNLNYTRWLPLLGDVVFLMLTALSTTSHRQC